MTHEGSASLISLGLSPHLSGEDSSIRWWLAGSFAFHAFLLLFLITLRLTPTLEKPFSSYEVSLINLSEVEAPRATPNVKTKAPKTAAPPPPKAKTAPSEPKAEPVLPPLAVPEPSEQLSESFSGAVQSVVVPNQLSLPTPSETEPVTTIKPTEQPNVRESIRLPKTAPKLIPAKPLEPQARVEISKPAPTPAPTPPQPTKSKPVPIPTKPNVRQETQKALQAIKAPPKAPTLKPIQPFKKSSPKDSPTPKVEKLSDALKKTIQSVKVPTPRSKVTKKKFPKRSQSVSPVIPPTRDLTTPKAPQLARVKPNQKPSQAPRVKQESISDSLKKILNTVKAPKLRKAPVVTASQPQKTQPKDQSSSGLRQRMERDTTKTQKLKTEIDQRLAKLRVPEVAPIESIKKRLQIQAVTVGEPSKGTSGSSSTSQSSAGQNRYLALIQDKIKKKWIAPPVTMKQNHPEVILKFRVLGSGEVMNLGIVQGSGNTSYDDAALRAVRAASPLPPIPKNLKSSSLDLHYKFRIGESSS